MIDDKPRGQRWEVDYLACSMSALLANGQDSLGPVCLLVCLFLA